MVEAVNGQSILLEKLRTNVLPLRHETNIIMALFRRSCYVHKSIFINLETLRNRSLVEIRKELNKIKSRLDEQSSSQPNLIGETKDSAEKLVDGMLQMEQIDRLIETWDQSEENLKNLTTDTKENATSREKITKSAKTYIQEHELRLERSITAIQHFRKDILLVQSVATDKWNHAILEDVFRLIQFFIRIFPKLSRKSKFCQGPIRKLQDDLGSLERLWIKLCEEHKDYIDVSQLEGSGRIPAKSIRELYIFNEISQRVLQGRLILVTESDMQEKANEIRKILKHPTQLARTDKLYKKPSSRAFILPSIRTLKKANTMKLQGQPGIQK